MAIEEVKTPMRASIGFEVTQSPVILKYLLTGKGDDSPGADSEGDEQQNGQRDKRHGVGGILLHFVLQDSQGKDRRLEGERRIVQNLSQGDLETFRDFFGGQLE